MDPEPVKIPKEAVFLPDRKVAVAVRDEIPITFMAIYERLHFSHTSDIEVYDSGAHATATYSDYNSDSETGLKGTTYPKLGHHTHAGLVKVNPIKCTECYK